MTKKLDLFWRSKREWWHAEGYKPVVNDDAPLEAKKSYEHYLQQMKKYTKKERIV